MYEGATAGGGISAIIMIIVYLTIGIGLPALIIGISIKYVRHIIRKDKEKHGEELHANTQNDEFMEYLKAVHHDDFERWKAEKSKQECHNYNAQKQDDYERWRAEKLKEQGKE